MKSSLEDVKVGQEVIWSGGGYYQTDSIAKVERITKTMVVITSGERFYKKSGRAVGKSSDFALTKRISLTGKEGLNKVKNDIRRAELIEEIKTYFRNASRVKSSAKISLEDLEAIERILNKASK